MALELTKESYTLEPIKHPPAPSTPEEAHAEASKFQLEHFETRRRIAARLGQFLTVLALLALYKTGQAALLSLDRMAIKGFHGLFAAMGEFLAGLPAAIRLLGVARPVPQVLGVIQPLERLALCLLLTVFCGRLLVRTALLVKVYSDPEHWFERSPAGLVLHTLGQVAAIAGVAWIASLAMTDGASDGLVAGLLACFLLFGAAWYLFLHLVARGLSANLLQQSLLSVLLAGGVFLVVLWPGVTGLWTRLGAAVLITLADSLFSLYLQAENVFGRPISHTLWRKTLFLTGSFAIILIAGGILAVVRP